MSTSPTAPPATRTWSNWAGNQQARMQRVAAPTSPQEVAETVRDAAARGLTVKPVGSGHSFTPAAVTDGVQIRLGNLARLRGADPATGLVTAEAGMPLWRLNELLAEQGLALTNMGDIQAQTVSGAIGTGTHGTGPHQRLHRGAGGRPRAGAGGRQHRRLLGRRSTLICSRRPGSRSAHRRDHRGDLPHRARLPARGTGGADASRRGPRGLRRAAHAERALRVLLVPAHLDDHDQAQQPDRGAGAAALASA